MAVLGLSAFMQSAPVLAGQRIFLRAPRPRDFDEWARLRGESRRFLEPWEPRWASDELDHSAWRMRMRRYKLDQASGTAYPFLLFEKPSGAMVGGITLSHVRRGVSQSGSIGYWMGERHAGQGLMLDAVKLVIHHGFTTLGLHRLEAACIPENNRSVRLLEKAGFAREGLMRSYLRINGIWQDHYLYALVAGERAPDTD